MTGVVTGKTGRRDVLYVTSNTTFQLANLAVTVTRADGTTYSENVARAYITQIMWSGNTAIQRGANTVWASAAGTTNHINLAANELDITEFSTANVTLLVNDLPATGAFLRVEVGKETTSNSQMW